jgi:formylglycine-generating enzyme required for sulfatase activity/lysophospholipase L1-like esterase
MRTVLWLGLCGCLLGADTPEGLKSGMPGAEVKKAQQEWARHLGQPVTKRVQVLHGVEMELSLVPPGELVMGSPEAENKDNGAELPHEVALSKPWYAGVHEVTQAQWEAVMGGNPARFKKDGAEKTAFPVENVSHNDCQLFVEKLRALTGLPFRLPTEAEWEYAARAGSSTAFWWGESLNGKEANCNGGKPFGTMETGPAVGKPCKVRSYAANPLGLYDTAGNVFEWCADWYGKYDPAQGADPQGPQSGKYRVVRGGSWGSPANLCRSGRRVFNDPASPGSSIGIGLRVVLDVPGKASKVGAVDVSRLLVLGNSVTQHGPLQSVSWEHNWGMAASAADKDFAHLLRGHLAKASGGAVELRVKNIAGFERTLARYDIAAELKEELAYGPTVIVVAVGRNAKEPGTPEEKNTYRTAFVQLLKALKEKSRAHMVVRSEFWAEPAKEAEVRQACEAAGVLYVDIGGPAGDAAHLGSAERKYEHAGVGGHPGDKGMQVIADRLWEGMRRGWTGQ